MQSSNILKPVCCCFANFYVFFFSGNIKQNIYSCQGLSQGKNTIFNAKVREFIHKNSVATLDKQLTRNFIDFIGNG